MRGSKTIVGLMSGTSADGIDVCIVDIEVRNSPDRPVLKYEILYSKTFPYQRALRRLVLEAATVEDVCRLDFALGEAFADAALRAIVSARVRKSRVAAIASHGQTIFHAPDAKKIGGFSSRSTLQVGNISVIAAKTGIKCVGNFRAKDVALGGQGAPLVPFVDFLLSPPEGAVWLNIGGISNITIVPPRARAKEIIAFDTGPGNSLIDKLVAKWSKGHLKFDRGGRLGLRGRVDERALEKMLANPYFKRRPPKSTGPEMFGNAFLARHRLRGSIEDAAATLAALTADTIASSMVQSWRNRAPLTLYASGGGVHNAAIMNRLRANLVDSCDAKVLTGETGCTGADEKEAFAFAVLGFCTLAGIPNNLPSVTGASRRAVLGEVALPS